MLTTAENSPSEETHAMLYYVGITNRFAFSRSETRHENLLNKLCRSPENILISAYEEQRGASSAFTDEFACNECVICVLPFTSAKYCAIQQI